MHLTLGKHDKGAFNHNVGPYRGWALRGRDLRYQYPVGGYRGELRRQEAQRGLMKTV